MAQLIKNMPINLKLLLQFTLMSLFFLTLSRVTHMLWLSDRVASSGIDFWHLLIQGFRFDLVLMGYLLLIPSLIVLTFSASQRMSTLLQYPLRVYIAVFFLFIVFMEFSTPPFIIQYDTRPNRLFLEYLIYPKEVLSMLWVGYKPQMLLSAIIIPASIFFIWKKQSKLVKNNNTLKWWQVIIITPLVVILLLIMARSSFQHRAINPSVASITPDPLVNDLIMNSSYSVMYAATELMDEDKKSKLSYGKMPIDTVIKYVRQETGYADSDFNSNNIPTLHHQTAINQTSKPYNLVIILEESLGAEFVGSLGGLPLTPHLDDLTKEGIWFDNLYATGTRSVRGIEAVVSGFTPTPARSVVKLSKSQRNFFTIAQYLSQKGYDTSFIYGGESHFDNMGRFFVGNGFKKITDELDYENPSFVGSWGVSDEDLFNKAHEAFLSKGDKPFFSLVFSSSNHSPFEYPEGKIELYDAEPKTVNNAVQYADYALGKFIEKAKTAPYWDNTIFLIIADHNSRVYGSSLVPIKRFHIPALILGKNIKPQTISTIASQIDMPVTLLSLMGISGAHPMIGRDMIQAKNQQKKGRAIMQFYSTQAYMQGDDVIIMEANKEPKQFVYSENKELIESNTDNKELMNKALAQAIWTPWVYENSKYKLP